jgi:hypothetical protein
MQKHNLQHSQPSWRLKLLLVAPLSSFLIFLKCFSFIPNHIKPEIDVITLPKWESILLGGWTWQCWPRDLLQGSPFSPLVYVADILAALVYVVHFVVPWGFGWYLYWFYHMNERRVEKGEEEKQKRRRMQRMQPWIFFWCLVSSR